MEQKLYAAAKGFYLCTYHTASNKGTNTINKICLYLLSFN